MTEKQFIAMKRRQIRRALSVTAAEMRHDLSEVLDPIALTQRYPFKCVSGAAISGAAAGWTVGSPANDVRAVWDHLLSTGARIALAALTSQFINSNQEISGPLPFSEQHMV